MATVEATTAGLPSYATFINLKKVVPSATTGYFAVESWSISRCPATGKGGCRSRGLHCNNGNLFCLLRKLLLARDPIVKKSQITEI
jgi:hypothetical protein